VHPQDNSNVRSKAHRSLQVDSKVHSEAHRSFHVDSKFLAGAHVSLRVDFQIPRRGSPKPDGDFQIPRRGSRELLRRLPNSAPRLTGAPSSTPNSAPRLTGAPRSASKFYAGLTPASASTSNSAPRLTEAPRSTSKFYAGAYACFRVDVQFRSEADRSPQVDFQILRRGLRLLSRRLPIPLRGSSEPPGRPQCPRRNLPEPPRPR